MVTGEFLYCLVSLILTVLLQQHIPFVMLPDHRIKFMEDFPAALKGCDVKSVSLSFEKHRQIKQKSLFLSKEAPCEMRYISPTEDSDTKIRTPAFNENYCF